MGRYGSWSTFCCPVGDDKMLEAKKWLDERVSAIDGAVRIIQNPHDFGIYPSFEIDRPDKFREEFLPDEDDPELSEEDEAILDEWDKWIDQINAIETEYNNLFNQLD